MQDLPGGWGPTLDDLEQRRRAARAMGGEDRLARHRGAGKLDARARADHLVDKGTFSEIGTLVGESTSPAPTVILQGFVLLFLQ